MGIFPNMSIFAKIFRVAPVHTADIERILSQLKLIKTCIRNRMQEQTLDSLLRIAIEGPPVEIFSAKDVVPTRNREDSYINYYYY